MSNNSFKIGDRVIGIRHGRASYGLIFVVEKLQGEYYPDRVYVRLEPNQPSVGGSMRAWDVQPENLKLLKTVKRKVV